MCDLIVCCAIPKNEKESEKLGTTLHSIEYLKFNNKYILFDGAPDKASAEKREVYTSLKEVFVKNSQFKVIENTENLYYKSMLEKFLMNTFDELNDNLFIIQDDVELGKIDLDTVLKDKEENKDCKILYFGENRPKAAHWFQEMKSTDPRFVKTHGWSERVYIITKKDLKDIFDFLKTFTRGGNNGKFIEYYYQNAMSRKSWKLMDESSKLDYWAIWGCFEYKGVFHRHLVMKR
tara:strand:+ start:1479 stop:2180 length:702 start_codon:yes stop_codon:yes gene_type:complete